MSVGTSIHGVLDNGLRWSHHRRELKVCCIALFVRCGSSFESVSNNGISHCLEHVVWNRRNLAGEARRALDRLLASGAEYDAFTSKEHMRVLIRCEPELLERAVEFLGLNLRRPRISSAALEHERASLLHENSAAFSSSRVLYRELLENALWGDAGPGLFLAGRNEALAGLTCQELERWWQRCFQPHRACIAAVGSFSGRRFRQVVDEQLAHWQPGVHQAPEPEVGWPTRSLAVPRRGGRVDLLVGFPAVAFASPDRAAVDLLSYVLGVGYDSRLLRAMRDESNLVYLVGAYAVSFAAAGYLGVRWNCHRTDAAASFRLLAETLWHLARDGLTADDLRRVKAARRLAALEAFDRGDSLLQTIGRRRLMGAEFSLEDELETFAAVGLEDVVGTARSLLDVEAASVVAFGLDPEELDGLPRVVPGVETPASTIGGELAR